MWCVWGFVGCGGGWGNFTTCGWWLSNGATEPETWTVSEKSQFLRTRLTQIYTTTYDNYVILNRCMEKFTISHTRPPPTQITADNQPLVPFTKPWLFSFYALTSERNARRLHGSEVKLFPVKENNVSSTIPRRVFSFVFSNFIMTSYVLLLYTFHNLHEVGFGGEVTGRRGSVYATAQHFTDCSGLMWTPVRVSVTCHSRKLQRRFWVLFFLARCVHPVCNTYYPHNTTSSPKETSHLNALIGISLTSLSAVWRTLFPLWQYIFRPVTFRSCIATGAGEGGSYFIVHVIYE